MSFRFVDLFAGIGGFHAALSGMGGRCILACEMDAAARDVYKRNWLSNRAAIPFPLDVARLATAPWMHNDYEVLAAGFPCQPFSKSGKQRGMDEARGTLFWSILKILEKTRPPLVLLENVRNLAGPRHSRDWAVIIRNLRNLGYKVSDAPTIFSPHLLAPEQGGSPQHRERVFIVGVLVGKERAWAEASDTPVVPNKPVGDWHPSQWQLRKYLAAQRAGDTFDRWATALAPDEEFAVNVWDEFVQRIRSDGGQLPGFPLWADGFRSRPVFPDEAPEWKRDFLRKNSAFYVRHKIEIRSWLKSSGVRDLQPSRRKLEWQARDASSLWKTIFHFRPSGIRARPITYVPALVAMAQTSVIGPERRRVTPQEAATLQGFPYDFDFGKQPNAKSYRQLGNAVAVGAVQYVLSEFVHANASELPKRMVNSVRGTRDNRRLGA